MFQLFLFSDTKCHLQRMWLSEKKSLALETFHSKPNTTSNINKSSSSFVSKHQDFLVSLLIKGGHFIKMPRLMRMPAACLNAQSELSSWFYGHLSFEDKFVQNPSFVTFIYEKVQHYSFKTQIAQNNPKFYLILGNEITVGI